MQTTELDCPLCMEPLEIDDVNFYPCTCGYQVCRFCWHRIRTDENGLCPACRKAYSEDPAVYTPLSQDEIQRIIKERKQKDTQRKQKLTENRKHLANVRVVQKNLVFVVGLTQRLADPELLKRPEYFGKFGKIHKIVINNSTNYAGPQGPSASAYITFNKEEDAHKAILTVGNAYLDGRTLKASLGTTKYCSYFLRNISCPKPDCMYLHDLGDEAASFTKEEMQEGKHQEYEQQLLSNYAQKMGVSTDKDTDDMWSGTPGSLPSGSNWDINDGDEESPFSNSPHRSSPTGYDESDQKHNENYWEDEIDQDNESPPPLQPPPPLQQQQPPLQQPPQQQPLQQQPQQQPPQQINNKEEERIDNENTNNNTLQTENKLQDSRHIQEYTTQQGWTPSHVHPSNTLLEYQAAPGIFEAGPSDTFCSLGLSNLHLKVSSDDDLGFDPWNESSKGLADLLREEVSQPPPIPQPGIFTGIQPRPGSFMHQLPQQYPANTKDDFKSWQEGFRALLPNININFAGWPSPPEGQHQTPSEWSPASQTAVQTDANSQAVRPPPGFEARKPEPPLATIDDPSIVWSKAIGSKSDPIPVIPGIIPNGFSSLSSNNTDQLGAVAVQSPGMLNNTGNPSIKQFLALFDTIDGDHHDSNQQTLQSQFDTQSGHNKKQSYLDRKTAANYHSKENGKIMSKDKHITMKPRENLKQPESNKRKITGRLA